MNESEETARYKQHLERHHHVLSDWLKQIASISAALIGFVSVFLKPDAYPGISWVSYAKVALLISALLTILAAITAHRGLWRSYLRLANEILRTRMSSPRLNGAQQKNGKNGPDKIEQFCISASFWLFFASICGLTACFIALSFENPNPSFQLIYCA